VISVSLLLVWYLMDSGENRLQRWHWNQPHSKYKFIVSRPKLKSLHTGIRFKLFTSHGGALIVLYMWFNYGTLTEALREAAKFFLVSIWNLTESWRMKATIKIMNNLPFSTVYLFIYLFAKPQLSFLMANYRGNGTYKAIKHGRTYIHYRHYSSSVQLPY